MKFVNDEFGVKRVICFPQEIIGNVIRNQCFEKITKQPNSKIKSNYFFNYKNKEVKFEKTISELYHDNNIEINDFNMTNDITVNNITSKNTIPNEIKEVEINVIKKTCFQKYKILIIILLIVAFIIILLLIFLIVFVLNITPD